MKKVLPLLIVIFLAFASCQRGPVMYTQATNSKEMVVNAEKFVKQTAKCSSHYSAEDWQVAVQQFAAMSEDFIKNKRTMTQEDVARFDAARLDFMKAVDENGSEDLAAQVKKVYSEIVEED